MAAAPAPAQAGIWTPLASGTTEEISALDYVSPSRLILATSSGKLLDGAPGATAVVATYPGRQFFDVAANPSGTRALAVADSGKLYRSITPGAWSATPLNLTNTTYGSACSPSGAPYAKTKAPTANLLAVAWSSDDVAWVVSAERGQILKSTDGGVTWTEVGQQADGTCRLDRLVTDVAPVPGSADDVYFVDDSFGRVSRTADGLATDAQARDDFVNCFNERMRLAVDPAAPNRVLVASDCESPLHAGFSPDSATTSVFVQSSRTRLRATAGAPGVFLSVGDAGAIDQVFDASRFAQQPADGDLATRDWRAVDLLDASRAVVGGVGGALVTTTSASTPPPTPAQSGGGTPTGPGTTTTPPTTSPPPPTRTLPTPTLAAKAPVVGNAARIVGRRVVLRVKGRLGVPAGVDRAAACRGTISVSVSKGKRRLASRRAKVGARCGYRTTVRVKRAKVGKAKRLKLEVAFRGNAVLGKLSSTYAVKVRR